MRAIFIIALLASLSISASAVEVESVNIPVGANIHPQVPDELLALSESSAQSSTSRGKSSLIRLSESKDILKAIYSANFARFADMQNQIPLGILIEEGDVSLSRLSKQFPQWVIAENTTNTYLAKLPIIIDVGAQLSLNNNDTLKLSQNHGSFIHNSGTLNIIGAKVSGWNETNNQTSKFNGDPSHFRPFIIGFGGSKTYISNAHIESLGYDESSSYGLTIRTATAAALNMLNAAERSIAERAPSIIIKNSTVMDLFTGIYLSGANNSAIVDNRFEGNTSNGIHVHHDSSYILINRNSVLGTKNKHGIVISSGVTNSFVTRNSVQNNAKSGIVIDKLSMHNLVAYNDISHNGSDGISVYESDSNRLYGNRSYQNGGHGIRVRSAQSTLIHHNILLANQGAGVYLHLKHANDNAPPISNNFVWGEIIGGLMVENSSGAIYSEQTFELVIGEIRAENNGSRAFRGDLELFEAAIINASWRDGTAAKILNKDSQ
ncbi:right-handed parallel beta-helix repeat-containing protein [Alteromonas facilis]|uniref:right-handed parallel beta-helix repeat-containing protein n=1 Tax=Alteromonas facilis TaxID=2048004 RepID=UPI000C2838E3|nr:right-handed parallel beta-helix repeat-containing protein [Alteromonas facilis]